MGNNGVQVIIAATILGVCILGGAFMVTQSVDRVSANIPQVELALKNVQTALVEVAKAKPAAPAPSKPRRRGPDPDKVYKVATAGNATKGPDSAKVKVVEFSDFQ